MSSGRWESTASRFGHLLGLSYYVYQWLIILGVGGFVSSLIVGVQNLAVSVILNVSILGALIGVFLWIRESQHRLRSPNPSLDILRLELTYTVMENGQYRHTRKVHLQARADGIEFYRHSFVWTGSGAVTARSIQKSHRAELVEADHGKDMISIVHFERPLAKGERVEVHYDLDLFDEQRKARPHLGLDVYSRVRGQVLMKVRFDITAQVETCRRQIFLSHIATVPVWEESVGLVGGRQISW